VALMMRYPMPQWANELHAVSTEDGWNIQLFRRKSSEAPGEPVLLVHGLAANRLNFEAPRGQAIVDTLVADGYDCWLVELRSCESATPPDGRDLGDVSFDDYLYKDLPAAIDYIRATTGHDKVHWVGHSMGAMLLYAYNAVFGSELLASGTALGAPAGFKNVTYAPPALLFRLNMAAPKTVRTFLKAVAPIARVFGPGFHAFPVNWNNVHPDIDTGVLFNMVEAVPPQVASELGEWLSTGNWRIRGRQVDITEKFGEAGLPLLMICGKGDPLTPEIPMRRFFDALPGKDKQFVLLSKKNEVSADYGHVDLLFGKHGTEEVYLPALQWIQNHPIKKVRRRPARKSAAAAKTAPVKAAETAKTPARTKAAPAKKTTAAKKPAATKKAAAAKKPTAKKKPAVKKAARTVPEESAPKKSSAKPRRS
jgi:pimeloyl-ACP methyl ester carboxylesterase